MEDWFVGVKKAEREILLQRLLFYKPHLYDTWFGMADPFTPTEPEERECECCGGEYEIQVTVYGVEYRCRCGVCFTIPTALALNLVFEWLERSVCKTNSDKWGTWKKQDFVDHNKYYDSPEWDERSEQTKESAGYRCQRCNRHKDEVILDAHHRTYIRFGHEMPEDLVCLCRPCHYEFHERFDYDKIRNSFYPIGETKLPPGWKNVDLDGWNKLKTQGKKQ